MNENEQKTTKSPIPIIFAIPFGPFLISPKTPPKENKLEIKILKIDIGMYVYRKMIALLISYKVSRKN